MRRRGGKNFGLLLKVQKKGSEGKKTVALLAKRWEEEGYRRVFKKVVQGKRGPPQRWG